MGIAGRNAAMVGGLALALLTGCGSASSPAVPGHTSSAETSRGPDFSQADVQRAIDDLAKLGIETRVRPSDAAPITAVAGNRSPIHLLRLQVRNLALEVAAGAGTRGVELDKLSAAAGGGPVSALVGAWAASGLTPAARWASALLGTATSADPAAIVYPTLALIAFVADARGDRQASDGPGGAMTAMFYGSGRTGPGEPARLVTSSSDFCAEVSAYLSAALDDTIDANADPPAWLKQLIDLYSPQYATDPGLLRKTIGAIALMTYATSLARTWTVTLVPEPAAVAYRIEGEDPVEGEVQVNVLSGEDVYSDDVVDCASLARAQLASIPVEGSSVIWDASGLGAHATEAAAEPKLDGNGSAGLSYETATESKDAAQNGDPVTAQMWVNAWVDRAEMASLGAIVKSILLGDAAGTPAGSTAKALYEVMEPTLNVVMRPSGFALIDVAYHTAKASASPSSSLESPTAAPSKPYDCEALVADEQMRAATGLADATLFSQDRWTDPGIAGFPVGQGGLTEGLTVCQYAARQGVGVQKFGYQIMLWIATGPAFTQYETAFHAAGGTTAGLDELPGIGDRAVYLAGTGQGFARKGGTLVMVGIRNTGSGPTIDEKAAIIDVLRLAIGRI